jgi:hypothetical protein
MYKPFQNRYKKEIILNYGRPYTNYTTYTIIDNKDKIAIVYVDKKSCNDNNLETCQLPENKLFYVEIHYTPSSNIPKFEDILLPTTLKTS